MSKALQDGEISGDEFKMVLNEMEKYSELKQGESRQQKTQK